MIDYTAVHILDNRIGGLQLQNSVITLDENIAAFIKRHITRSLNKGVQGIFLDRATSTSWRSINNAFTDPTANFLDSTKELATNLFEKMTRKTIKPGTLWFVAFHHAETGERGLGILKMDDTPAVVYDTVDGKLTNLQIREHALPSDKIEIDKAAFIVPENECLPECHLRMIDRRRTDDEVARFFQDFLECQPANSAQTNTKRFMAAVDKWAQTHADEVNATGYINAEHVKQSRRATVASHSEIDVESFATTVFGDNFPELRDSLAASVLQEVGDPRFEVDVRVQTKYQNRKIVLTRGDKKIVIMGNRESIDHLIQREQQDNGRMRIIIDDALWSDEDP